MKILFITHHYLSNNGGGSFASRAYINAFAEVADEMTLLYPVKEGENVFQGINSKIKLMPIAYSKPKLGKLFDSLIGKVHRYYNVAPQEIRSGKYDIVVFDTSIVSYGMLDIAKNTGSKTIVIHHNYQYEYFRDNVKGVLKRNTLFWCKQYEGESVRKADLNLTLTNQDADLLANAYNSGNKLNYWLLGVFEFAPIIKLDLKCKENTQRRFVITGNLSAIQTEDSLIPWINEYYPILKEMFPNATLTIAGKSPSQLICEMCNERNINIIPSPVSMDSIMENADYYICPTSLGGGIKLRIMDGLRWGLPIVAHEVSVRGYDLFVEKGCMFSYADKDSFREALYKLKMTAMSCQNVGGLYSSIFSFEAGVERVKKIVYSLIS